MAKMTKSLPERLREDYARWDDLHEHGGHDPNWPDGCNLQLVRNHIISDKVRIEQEMDPKDYPEEYFQPLPPDVPVGYMANPDQIISRAKKAIAVIQASKDYAWISEHMYDPEIPKAERQKMAAVMGRIGDGMMAAANGDDLVRLRSTFWNGPDDVLSDMSRIRSRIGVSRLSAQPQEENSEGIPGQMSIFDFLGGDPE